MRRHGHGAWWSRQIAIDGVVLLRRDATACRQLFRLLPTHRVEHFCNVGVVLPHDALGGALSSFALDITLAQLHTVAATGDGWMDRGWEVDAQAPHSASQQHSTPTAAHSAVTCAASEQAARLTTGISLTTSCLPFSTRSSLDSHSPSGRQAARSRGRACSNAQSAHAASGRHATKGGSGVMRA